MRKGVSLFLFFVFVTVMGCREPFDFDYPDVLNPKVVIDGFISDQVAPHEVRVSFSTTINNFGLIETQFIENATVRIEDDQGGFTILTHFEAGIYRTSPQFRAREGRTYTLEVTLADGRTFQSPPKTLPVAGAATAQLSVQGDTRETLVNNSVQDEEGAQIMATIDKDNERHFYQWLIGHYYIHEADLAPDNDVRFCYVRDFDVSRIELLQDNPVGSGEADQYTYEIDFVPITAKMEHQFGVEGRLLTMHEEDYNFWDKAERLAENSGGLFDAAPFSLEGNITNPATGEPALGYFGVYRESIDRVFFDQAELGFRIRTFTPCTIPFMADRPHPCEDCRLVLSKENFGVVRPNWWGD